MYVEVDVRALGLLLCDHVLDVLQFDVPAILWQRNLALKIEM